MSHIHTHMCAQPSIYIYTISCVFCFVSLSCCVGSGHARTCTCTHTHAHPPSPPLCHSSTPHRIPSHRIHCFCGHRPSHLIPSLLTPQHATPQHSTPRPDRTEQNRRSHQACPALPHTSRVVVHVPPCTDAVDRSTNNRAHAAIPSREYPDPSEPGSQA